ncbi:CRP1 [Symbiodinium microadriaticum]|nr:CRP1 [Symbiodinium microadriaticum]
MLASMTKQHLLANQVTYGALAAACANAATWRAAIAILQHGLQQDQTGLIISSSVLSACEKSTAWMAAVSLIRSLAASTRLDMIAFSAVISCTEKAGRWLEAVNSLSRLLLTGISPGVVTLNALVSACKWNGQWERALVKLTFLRRLLQPDVVSYTAATVACGASGKWLDAILLWAAMRSGGVIPNIIMHNSLISVCEESGQWEMALDVIEQKTPRRAYTTVTINSGISACTRGIRWNQALHLFGSLLQPEQQLQPTLVSFLPEHPQI